MDIWLVQANEPMPTVDINQRPFRTGMLADELVKRNHKVVWFATTFEHYTKTQRYTEKKEIKVKDNFLLKLVWSPGYKKNVSFKRIIDHKIMAKNIEKEMKLVDKPNLIYCSFPTIDLAYVAVQYGIKHNVKVIIDVRDLWPDIFLDRLKGIMKLFAYPYYLLCNRKTKYILRHAYAVHSVSNEALCWSLNKIKRNKQKDDYFYFIGNGDNSINDENRNDRVKKPSCILITGFSKSINYKLIVQVANQLPDTFILKMVGDGPELEKFKELAKNCKNIKFYGWCNQEQMDQALKSSSIALLGYNNSFDFKMGAGNKFGQALSYSLPVVVTCNGVMEHLLEENKCGIYSENAKEIASYMVNLLNDEIKYRQASTNAKLLFNNMFNSNEIYKNLVDNLEEMERN